MAILTKAAPVLQVEHFVDMMPVAWELLLETDQELSAAAGKTPHCQKDLHIYILEILGCFVIYIRLLVFYLGGSKLITESS